MASSTSERPSIPDDLLPTVDRCTYTSCYCEENVWKLCKHVQVHAQQHLSSCHCVFISNKNKLIPLWSQKVAKTPEQPVYWDYHVIFVYSLNGAFSWVYDMDSVMPFPCSFSDYLEKVVGSDLKMKPEFARYFRVIPAQLFLETFASDRSHMKMDDGSWNSPPPSYPCLQTAESKNNIQDFISMENKVGVGEVMDFTMFEAKFSNRRFIAQETCSHNGYD